MTVAYKTFYMCMMYMCICLHIFVYMIYIHTYIHIHTCVSFGNIDKRHCTSNHLSFISRITSCPDLLRFWCLLSILDFSFKIWNIVGQLAGVVTLSFRHRDPCIDCSTFPKCFSSELEPNLKSVLYKNVIILFFIFLICTSFPCNHC